ncbi:type II toxin-antitoxin system death-on-curing family toxin [Mycobacterium sp. NPDC003449]
MTDYLDREDVLIAGSIAFGGELTVRDYGLLDAAVARPQATVFGVDAYPELWDKAAALLQSLARNPALVDGNKRTAWAAAWTFLHINGIELAVDFDVDRAEDLMNDAATQDRDVADIAASLAGFAAR